MAVSLSDLKTGMRFLYHDVGEIEIYEGKIIEIAPSGKYFKITHADGEWVRFRWVEYNEGLRDTLGITILEVLREGNGTGATKD